VNPTRPIKLLIVLLKTLWGRGWTIGDERSWFLCWYLSLELGAWMRTGLVADDTRIHRLRPVSVLGIRSVDRLPTATHVENDGKWAELSNMADLQRDS